MKIIITENQLKIIKENVDGTPEKVSKQTIDYTDKSSHENEYCSNCGWFSNNTCKMVIGNINPNGWCKLWGTKKFC